jgi:hypothetical protein
MKKLALAFLLALPPTTVTAQSRTQEAKLWGMNVHIVMSTLKIKSTRKCGEAEWEKLSEKAYEISIGLKPSKADEALMRKNGYDPTKPGQFLEMSFGVACLKGGDLGIKFPTTGEGKQRYLYKEERGWYSVDSLICRRCSRQQPSSAIVQ